MRHSAANILSILILLSGCATSGISRSTVGSAEWVVPVVDAKYESDVEELQVGTDLFANDRILTRNTGRTHVRLINRSDILLGPNCDYELDDTVTEIRPVGTKLVNLDWKTNPFSIVECVANIGASSNNPITIDFGDLAIFVTNRLVTLDRVPSRLPFCGVAALRLFIDGRIDDAVEEGFVEITAKDRNLIIDKLQNAIIIELCNESLSVRELGVDEHLHQIRRLEDEGKISKRLPEPEDDGPDAGDGLTFVPEPVPPPPQEPKAGDINLGKIKTNSVGLAPIPVADILANSTDPQGNNTITLTGVGGAQGKSDGGQPVSLGSDQNNPAVQYDVNTADPDSPKSGTDSFDFTITDQDGNSDSGKADIDVLPFIPVII